MASITVPGWCIRTLQRIADDLANYDGGRLHSDFLDAHQVQLELSFRELVATEVFEESGSLAGRVIGLVREALSIVRNEAERNDRDISSYQAPLVCEGVGRPTFCIPRNQLAYLLENRFTCPRIADILGVSLRTVRRRMTEYNLSIHMLYTALTDDQLDGIVSEIQHEFPTCGNRQMQGHLLARAVRVQQQRIRESQRRVDPSGSVMRRLRTINRRQYCVNGPGALWHIDGNHKLIRYNNY